MARAATYANFADVKRRKPVRWWHEAIIDDMLAFPLSTLAERAGRLGYDKAYLSVIINSDMFRAVYEERRAAYRENLDATLIHKTAQVANSALDLMLEQLETKRGAIPFQALADTADKTLSRLGYGVKPQAGGLSVSVTANGGNVAVVPSVTAEQLAEARLALQRSEQLRVVDARPVAATAPLPEAAASLPQLPALEPEER
jgi:hypothetical protein